MTDDHAAHAISAYGSRINRTPQVDRLAEEGLRFSNYFCTNSICAPSRASILTGLYSHTHGVIDNRTRLDAGKPMFPQLLQRAGYETALVGKWHLKSEPTGFDYWNVLPGQGMYYNPDFIEMGERKPYTATLPISPLTSRWTGWIAATGAGPFACCCITRRRTATGCPARNNFTCTATGQSRSHRICSMITPAAVRLRA